MVEYIAFICTAALILLVGLEIKAPSPPVKGWRWALPFIKWFLITVLYLCIL